MSSLSCHSYDVPYSLLTTADKSGYKLSDRGLRVRRHGNNSKDEILGPYIPCFSERDIFEALKLDYKEPWEREGKVMHNGMEV